jgi:hypothetical protein
MKMIGQDYWGLVVALSAALDITYSCDGGMFFVATFVSTGMLIWWNAE